MVSSEIVDALLSDVESYRDSILAMLESHCVGAFMEVDDDSLDTFLSYKDGNLAKKILIEQIEGSLTRKVYWMGWFKGLPSEKCEEIERLSIRIENIINSHND